MTDTNKLAAAHGTLDDKALDDVAGGRGDGLGFLAGALIGGVVGIIEGATAHQQPAPNVVFGVAPQQFIQAPPTVFVQPQFAAPQPQFIQAPQYQQQQVIQTFGTVPVANSGW